MSKPNYLETKMKQKQGMATMKQQAGFGLVLGLALLIAIVALVGVIASVSGVETKEARWLKFSTAHDCKAVGHTATSFFTPGETEYRCNDGNKYWR